MLLVGAASLAVGAVREGGDDPGGCGQVLQLFYW